MKALITVRHLLIYKQFLSDNNLTDDSAIKSCEEIRCFVLEQIEPDKYIEYMEVFSHHYVIAALDLIVAT
jgi:hypothetical protein